MTKRPTWRLLDTPPMSAADNMALDETLVELRGEGKTPNTIHFLQFTPRAVLVGYHQSLAEELRLDYCREHGIEVNRRVTGGGAILFDENQLGWEVIADKDFFGVAVPNEKLFRALCDPVVLALARLGISANFRPRNDIEVNGRKISGTGGTDHKGAFLFQGTMLVDFDVQTMLRALRIPVEKLKAKEIDSVKDRVTCLAWELGHVPPLDEIKAAIREGFSQHLGIELVDGSLTPDEQALFAEKRSYYHDWDRWIDHVRPRNPKLSRRDTVQSSYKGEAGMVRVTLAADLPGRRVKDIYLTGDFLSFPSRALYDLEAALRGARLDPEHLRGIVRGFFADGKIMIPGMDADDFLKPLDQALEKLAITRFGLPVEHCNRISVTNGSFAEVAALNPSVLLLPYCAKWTECDLRHKKPCKACGEHDCTVGPAWVMGRTRRMEVRTIVSFEDLQEELARIKGAGATAFIGCCCQPFFAKHVDDFAASGMPGILIDIDNTTCYDLDQAKEAYAGRFESQTVLDLDLLHGVLEVCERESLAAGTLSGGPSRQVEERS